MHELHRNVFIYSLSLKNNRFFSFAGESERDNAVEESVSGPHHVVLFRNHPQGHALHLRQSGEERPTRQDNKPRMPRHAHR